MREAGRRKPQLWRSLDRVFGTLLMRQVVEQDDRAADLAIGASQRRNLGPDRDRARPDVEDRVGIAEVLAGFEASYGASWPASRSVDDTAEEGATELRNAQHRLGGGIDGDWLEVAIDHDDRIGKAVEDIPPQIAGGFLDGVSGGGTRAKSITPKGVLKGFDSAQAQEQYSSVINMTFWKH